jgi:transcriptional regulator with XRE-family HTH domain
MSTTIGQQLRQTRQERDIPLEQVARATHIRLHYLQAIEAGDLDRLPSPVQARGFLRAYASYLGLDPELLLLSINGERRPDAVPAQPPDQGGDEVAAAPSPRHSGAILAEIGEQLQRQRELLGLSLEVLNATRICGFFTCVPWNQAVCRICLHRFRGAACLKIMPSSWVWILNRSC